MPIVSDFYAIITVLFVVIFVLTSDSSFSKKATVLLILCLILLWIEKPDWFVLLLQKAIRAF